MATQLAEWADEVLLVMPEQLPHKRFDGASFAQRLQMLMGIAEGDQFRVCSASRGLFLEIASQCRETYPNADIAIACGRDAAERALSWPYEDASAIDALFALAELWVFARHGCMDAPVRWQQKVKAIAFGEDLQEVSATEVRRRIACGEAWQHLVPVSIHPLVQGIYATG